MLQRVSGDLLRQRANAANKLIRLSVDKQAAVQIPEGDAAPVGEPVIAAGPAVVGGQRERAAPGDGHSLLDGDGAGGVKRQPAGARPAEWRLHVDVECA